MSAAAETVVRSIGSQTTTPPETEQGGTLEQREVRVISNTQSNCTTVLGTIIFVASLSLALIGVLCLTNVIAITALGGATASGIMFGAGILGMGIGTLMTAKSFCFNAQRQT